MKVISDETYFKTLLQQLYIFLFSIAPASAAEGKPGGQKLKQVGVGTYQVIEEPSGGKGKGTVTSTTVSEHDIIEVIQKDIPVESPKKRGRKRRQDNKQGK